MVEYQLSMYDALGSTIKIHIIPLTVSQKVLKSKSRKAFEGHLLITTLMK